MTIEEREMKEKGYYLSADRKPVFYDENAMEYGTVGQVWKIEADGSHTKIYETEKLFGTDFQAAKLQAEREYKAMLVWEDDLANGDNLRNVAC